MGDVREQLFQRECKEREGQEWLLEDILDPIVSIKTLHRFRLLINIKNSNNVSKTPNKSAGLINTETKISISRNRLLSPDSNNISENEQEWLLKELHINQEEGKIEWQGEKKKKIIKGNFPLTGKRFPIKSQREYH